VEHVERKRKKIKIGTTFVCAPDQSSVEKSSRKKKIINKKRRIFVYTSLLDKYGRNQLIPFTILNILP